MYTIVRGLLSTEQAESIAQRLDTLDLQVEDTTTGGSQDVYAPCDDILVQVQDQIEQFVEEPLYPTYSFGRKYYKNCHLIPHKDRASCELTITVNIKNSASPWPIWLRDGTKYVEVILEPGDALVMEGYKYQHWRDPLDEDYVYQIFLHYVRQNGKFADCKFDKRETLAI